jgi:hypothetical protein
MSTGAMNEVPAPTVAPLVPTVAAFVSLPGATTPLVDVPSDPALVAKPGVTPASALLFALANAEPLPNGAWLAFVFAVSVVTLVAAGPVCVTPVVLVEVFAPGGCEPTGLCAAGLKGPLVSRLVCMDGWPGAELSGATVVRVGLPTTLPPGVAGLATAMAA